MRLLMVTETFSSDLSKEFGVDKCEHACSAGQCDKKIFTFQIMFPVIIGESETYKFWNV